MRFVNSWWFPVLLGAITLLMVLSGILFPRSKVKSLSYPHTYTENELWVPPSESLIGSDAGGDLIRYGKELIANTAKYLGPKGIVAAKSNGMNCQNCHLDAGRVNFANPFSAVASTYPTYRHRSGRVESIEFRINDCMQRSLNGQPLDSLSTEMRAMVAYLKWVGQGVPEGVRPVGFGTGKLPLLNRAADPAKGKLIYQQHCVRCHGPNGEGLPAADSSYYTYPPLWGDKSFNVSAGLYRLSMMAGFIKNNMPFDLTNNTPRLSEEDAWDVAAFVVSQPRPEVFFSFDWPDISKKPVDFPYGPFADNLSELQHKYGPFSPVKK